MKFSVKDIKITLRTDSGETVVVEESCDASEEKRFKGKTQKTEPKRETKVSERPTGPRNEGTAEAKPEREKVSERPAPAPKAKAAASTKKSSLTWKPHAEFGYDGFAAKDGHGTYKLLKSKSTQWGLFYDQVGVDSVPLGCYRELEAAKVAAQKQFEKGMPDKRRIPQVCPADAPEATPQPEESTPKLTPEMRTEMKTTPKTEASATPAAPLSDVDKDKELLGSFNSELDALLDEDEDD